MNHQEGCTEKAQGRMAQEGAHQSTWMKRSAQKSMRKLDDLVPAKILKK